MDSPTSPSGDLDKTDGFDMNEDISAPPNIETVLLNPYRWIFLVVKPKPCHHHGFSDDPVCAGDSFPSGSSSTGISVEQPVIEEPINSCNCFLCPEEVLPVCCCQRFTKIQQGCQGISIYFLGLSPIFNCLADLDISCVTLMPKFEKMMDQVGTIKMGSLCK